MKKSNCYFRLIFVLLIKLAFNLFLELSKTCSQFDAKLLGIGQNQKANIC